MSPALRARAVLFAVASACAIAACAEKPSIERCPEGQIATVSGCLPVPTHDAGDGLRRDATPLPDAVGTNDQDAEVPADSGSDAGVDPDPRDAGLDDAGTARLELSGVWALRIADEELVTSETLSTTETVTIYTLARVVLAHRDVEVDVETQICAINSTPFSNFTTIHPPAAIASLPIDQNNAKLSTLSIGASFDAERRVELMGWRSMLDPVLDQLPETADDPRVIDGDNDQFPGVTLEVTGLVSGEISVASRVIVTLHGTVIDGDRIEGRAETTRARNILDATNDLLLGAVTFSRSPRAAGSYFVLVRLPPDIQPNCESLIDREEELFR